MGIAKLACNKGGQRIKIISVSNWKPPQQWPLLVVSCGGFDLWSVHLSVPMEESYNGRGGAIFTTENRYNSDGTRK